ncbi:hypothetical protein ACGFYK_38460, partial [Streptomyces sp. NPDC048340]
MVPSYRNHRYPVEVISHCVWLYFRFPLSFREVEELMLERGIVVSYETVRRWCLRSRISTDHGTCRSNEFSARVIFGRPVHEGGAS